MAKSRTASAQGRAKVTAMAKPRGGNALRPLATKAASAQDARKARGLERRDAILTAALEEFSARGFEATRLDDVAARARIAKVP